MGTGRTGLRTVVAACLAGGTAACEWLSPVPQHQPPLPPAAQQAAAEKLATAFAGACLTETTPDAAIRTLRAAGWPSFSTVWRDPGSVFYAAPPQPAGLFVISDRSQGEVARAQRLTCVGHYPAESAAPMVAAIARRWGPGRVGAGPYPGAQIWTFQTKDGAITPVVAAGGLSADDTALLAPGEAHAYVQVVYNPTLGDVASLIAVSRPVRQSR